MTLRDLRSVFELAVVALVMWAGLYYTPMGALVRSVGGFFVGSSSSRSLLSYYSGGVGDLRTQRLELVAQPVEPLTTKQARGWGAYSAYKHSTMQTQQVVRTSIDALGGNSARVDNAITGPDELATALERLKARGLSDDAALLVLFAGEEAGSFADRRARGEGRGAELDDLARQLPPGYEANVEGASLAAMLSVGYTLGWPGPRDAPVTSPFGWRTHPVTGEKKFHKGIDLGISTGTDVRAAAAGVVVRSSSDSYNGNIVVVAHGENARTLYLHNSERLVSVGDKVQQGDLIARSGATGIATGPHLHYQLELGGEPYDPLLFGGRRTDPVVVTHKSDPPPPVVKGKGKPKKK